MRYLWVLVLFLLSGILLPAPASAQQTMTKGDKNWMELEKVLDDANQQWLCVGKYHKPKRQDCVNFRASLWVDQFFEIYPSGQIATKADMVASQTAGAPAADKLNPTGIPGVGPNPQDFKLMAVYGDLAMGVDRTIFKTIDASGNLVVTSEARVLRIFAKENGTWRPASAALVGIPKQ